MCITLAKRQIVRITLIFMPILLHLDVYSQDVEKLPQLIPYRKGDKWGYVDRSKKIVIPFTVYDFAEPFNNGFAKVNLGGKPDKSAFRVKDGNWGLIDTTGKVVVTLNYDEIKSFQEGFAAVKLSNKWGFVDKAGKLVIPLKYDDVTSFQNGFARVAQEGWVLKWGFIDRTGKEVTPIKYVKA